MRKIGRSSGLEGFAVTVDRDNGVRNRLGIRAHRIYDLHVDSMNINIPYRIDNDVS